MTRERRPDVPFWLTARPIAHRGLHDAGAGVIENTLAAAQAAVARDYAIECDVELSRDAEAVVFHDATLDRLTRASGRVADFSARELGAVAFRDAQDARIVSLRTFLRAVAGQAPVIIEIKSRFDGDFRLAARVVETLAGYAGPAAVKCFDPVVVAFLHARRTARPIGLVAQADYPAETWPRLSGRQRALLAAFVDFAEAQPDFLSWRAADLPHAAPQLCRSALGLPVMVWTVRSPAERDRAAPFADQILFEGFSP